MHALHARLPKNFVLEDRLERYADAIEPAPARWAGRWAEACYPLPFAACDPVTNDAASPHAGTLRYREVRLDLGCGKGGFTAEMARREPDVLFVGVDFEPICIAYAAERAVTGGLANMVLVPATGEGVSDVFGPGELDGIYLNFPTPFPRKKDAGLRLTHLDRLVEYRRLLAPGASVILKTDSYPLWRFSQTQFDLAGYTTLWRSEDARAERPDDAMSWYEQRLCAQGAAVFALEATPGHLARRPRQTASLSLVDYLPDDVESMGYVPHGMQDTVTNLRNQRLKARMGRDGAHS